MIREARLIADAVKTFDLNLAPFVVFTEAASGHFRWTPIIALQAGASRVFALAKDSQFGDARQIAQDTLALAKDLGVAERLTVVFDTAAIDKADIVTNTGAVRPLSAPVIDRLKRSATIPLMWETWEFRPSDLDLGKCFQRGILVLGTNESHESLGFYRYVGLLAVKLLLETDIELFKSRILVVGSPPFGASIAQTLRDLHADVAIVAEDDSPPGGDAAHSDPRAIAQRLRDRAAREFLLTADAVVFAEHRSERMLVGPSGDLSVAELFHGNPDLRVIHISGLVDGEALLRLGKAVVPKNITRRARSMSVTTAYLGPRPVIALHAAGLRVGQEMASARRNAPTERARIEALKNPLCQDFSPEQKQLYGAA